MIPLNRKADIVAELLGEDPADVRDAWRAMAAAERRPSVVRFKPGDLAELDRLDAKSEQYGYGWNNARDEEE